MEEGDEKEQKKTPQETGREGGLIRAERLTPERRAEIARRAAEQRWVKQRLLGLYPRKGTNLRKAEWYIRSLQRLLGKAVEREDFKEARNCIQTLLGAERMRIWLETQAGKPGESALEVEGRLVEDETTRRLKESRMRREAALRDGDREEIVIVEEAGKE